MRNPLVAVKHVYMPRKGMADHSFFLKEFLIDHTPKFSKDSEKVDEEEDPFPKSAPAASQVSNGKELGKRKPEDAGHSEKQQQPVPKRPIRFVISKH